ncbi:hypothetical protein EWH70_18510 [Amycolatopsis suaedae]|uniref:Uncharacterized protein n=1 Tax=Amycolatopsis suaedae TaxID=2510978 RepID=A0A4V2ELP4_9PSEU|nr:daptide biosynthesis RiPP recognition protein [Amycolatopsis suaedae]RZQ62275.1 hypothetical protein EWH70_18510 [Amycolatopsis suaedae]
MWSLESAEHADFAARMLGAGDLVLIPAGTPDLPALRAKTLTFDGALLATGDVAVVGGARLLRVQDYLSVAFTPVTGPTAVRVTGPADLGAFLADADLARNSGVFVDQLTHPMVWLGDRCALGDGERCGASTLSRLHVTGSGQVHPAPGGAPIGRVSSTMEELGRGAQLAAVRGDPCLAGVVSAPMLAAAVADRPWLGRYLRALDALRAVRTTSEARFRVSGFGARLVGGLRPHRMERADEPLVLFTDEDFVVYQPGEDRCLRLGRDDAAITELLVATASPDASALLATALLGFDRHFAEAAVVEVGNRCAGAGIRLPHLEGVR